MYDELVKRLRNLAELIPKKHKLPTGADTVICSLEAFKQFKELAEEAADAIEKLTTRDTNVPRWIPVTEALPESVDDDVLVTDGEGYAVGYWRPDAQAWDSTDFGWLENRSEPPCGIHTVTHWMPLPPLPEPPKEET